MKSAWFIAVALITCVSAPCVWSQEDTNPKLYGPGASATCQTWIDARRTGTDERVLRAWMDGFVSQASLALGDVKRTDQTRLDAFMDSYCAAHPKVGLDLAAAALVGKLRQH